jgi:hypothetical protein
LFFTASRNRRTRRVWPHPASPRRSATKARRLRSPGRIRRMRRRTHPRAGARLATIANASVPAFWDTPSAGYGDTYFGIPHVADRCGVGLLRQLVRTGTVRSSAERCGLRSGSRCDQADVYFVAVAGCVPAKGLGRRLRRKALTNDGLPSISSRPERTACP